MPSLTSKKKGAFTTSKTLIDVIIHNEDMITDVSCIGCPFSDHHFVLASIDITLEKIKPELPDKGRHFSETNLNLINEKINSIDLSKIDFDADVDTIWKCIVAGLPTKLLKCNTYWWAKCLTKLFNKCIELKQVPIEFKTAVVTPFFKKGDKNDLNNYRGISVLPPVSKIFEKILATQIITFFNINKKFYNGQHGFRASHSCETALHELLTDLNEVKSKKMIALLLFIDYRKAFDLVYSRILLRKLFHYGFDSQSIELIANYFKNRTQTVKYNNKKSDFCDVELGVPQGSVLGPLFFLIFINDLAFTLDLSDVR